MFEDCDERASKEFQYLNLGQIWIWLKIDSGFPGGSAVKNQPAVHEPQEIMGSIPGLGRSPGRGYGNPLQYSCSESPMYRGAWWVSP